MSYIQTMKSNSILHKNIFRHDDGETILNLCQLVSRRPVLHVNTVNIVKY